MPKIFGVGEAVPKGNTALYYCVFKEPVVVSGAIVQTAIDSNAITAISATIKDAATGDVVSRNAQNVKNANGGTLGTEGAFTLRLTADDTALRTGEEQRQEYVKRILLLVVTFTQADAITPGTLRHEVTFYIQNAG